jgi:hypothetical protein
MAVRSRPNPAENKVRASFRNIGCDVAAVSFVRSQNNEFAIVTPIAENSEEKLLEFLTDPKNDWLEVVDTEPAEYWNSTSYYIAWTAAGRDRVYARPW